MDSELRYAASKAASFDHISRVSVAFPKGEGYETRIPLFSHCQSEYTHVWKNNTGEQSLPLEGKAERTGAERPITICGEAAATTLNP